jgi:hypothetical protein
MWLHSSSSGYVPCTEAKDAFNGDNHKPREMQGWQGGLGKRGTWICPGA